MRAFLLCFPPVLFPTLDHLVLSSIIHHVVSVKSNLPLRTSDLNRGDCLHKWERADYLPLPPGFTFVPAFNRCPYVIKQDFAEGKVCSKEVFQLLVLFHFCFLELEKFTKWFHRVPLNSNEIGTQKSQWKIVRNKKTCLCRGDGFNYSVNMASYQMGHRKRET